MDHYTKVNFYSTTVVWNACFLLVHLISTALQWYKFLLWMSVSCNCNVNNLQTTYFLVVINSNSNENGERKDEWCPLRELLFQWLSLWKWIKNVNFLFFSSLFKHFSWHFFWRWVPAYFWVFFTIGKTLWLFCQQ